MSVTSSKSISSHSSCTMFYMCMANNQFMIDHSFLSSFLYHSIDCFLNSLSSLILFSANCIICGKSFKAINLNVFVTWKMFTLNLPFDMIIKIFLNIYLDFFNINFAKIYLRYLRLRLCYFPRIYALLSMHQTYIFITVWVQYILAMGSLLYIQIANGQKSRLT